MQMHAADPETSTSSTFGDLDECILTLSDCNYKNHNYHNLSNFSPKHPYTPFIVR